MRFPSLPPDTNAIFNRMIAEGPDRARALWSNSSLVDAKGRYLHWDELRFKPAPEGLNHEEWWTAVKMARDVSRQTLPLLDAKGELFSFCEPPTLKASLRYLDMNAGGALRADSHSPSTGEGRAHLTSSLAEEPFASSLIAGAATTRQIAKKLIFEGRQPQTVDERMVLNNYRAMEFVKQNRSSPLTMPLLLELHRIVTEGTLPNELDAGRIRMNDEVRVVDSQTDDILHQPPPAAVLSDRLEALFRFANEESTNETWVHPLLKAMIIHFMLAYEHPFVDGNGRVARALFYWYALRAGYWLMEYVSISTVIARSKIDYDRSFLFVETDDADVTYFLANQADTLREALRSLHAYVEKKKGEVRALEKRLMDWARPDAFNHRQASLLNALFRGNLSQTTISEHEARHGVSYLTSRSDLEKLKAEGYLIKSKRGQVSIYRAAEDLEQRLRAA